MSFISYLVNGLSLGSVYALIALGYTMVYGIAKMLNFAHGDVIMIGAYVALITMKQAGLPTWVAILISIIVTLAVFLTDFIIFFYKCVSQYPDPFVGRLLFKITYR